MPPSILNEVFKIARESEQLTQDALAKLVGVDRSSISKFETGFPALDEQNLLKLARLLSVDENYIKGKEGNPFLSSKLIRILVPGLISADSSFFDLLISHTAKIEFLSLIPQFNIIEAIANLGLYSLPIAAVAARDEKGNVFLMRKKFKHDFIVRTNEGNLEKKLSKLLYIAGKDRGQVHFRTLPIGAELTKKIKDWKDVTKDDIAPLFDRAKIVATLLSVLKEIRPTDIEIKTAVRQYNLSKKVEANGYLHP